MSLRDGTSDYPQETTSNSMPDVSLEQRPRVNGVLHKVGMSEIHVRAILDTEGGCQVAVPAVAEAFVSLDNPDDKGIHMSRLFLGLQETLDAHPVNPSTIRLLLDRFLDSHAGQSRSAFVSLSFDHMLRRPALVSDNSGWMKYPVTIGGQLVGDSICFEVATQITYSSTCPCSAALSRSLTKQRFLDSFSSSEVTREDVATWLGAETGMAGTPHSQRSLGSVKIRFSDPKAFLGFEAIIDRLEGAVGTAVQAAVKREDEQEFARINANNLMFCEDAARTIRAAIEEAPGIEDYWIEARHLESLHPHDAVSIVTKGVANGYRA